MSNLDEELKDALECYRDDIHANDLAEEKTGINNYDLILGRAISDIKQVFKEAKWHGPTPETIAYVKAAEKGKKQLGLMTGQEWYDKFKAVCDNGDSKIFPHEKPNMPLEEVPDYVYKHILLAARKAAGLE